MKDLWDSFRLQLYDRLSSPLFGAFVFSWIAWNHHYLFILFSDQDVYSRIGMAKKLFFSTWIDVVLRGGLYPLLSAIFFIVTYPPASRWAFVYWRKNENKLKVMRTEIEMKVS